MDLKDDTQVAVLNRIDYISDVNYPDMAWDFGDSFCPSPPPPAPCQKNVLKKFYDQEPTRRLRNGGKGETMLSH